MTAGDFQWQFEAPNATGSRSDHEDARSTARRPPLASRRSSRRREAGRPGNLRPSVDRRVSMTAMASFISLLLVEQLPSEPIDRLSRPIVGGKARPHGYPLCVLATLSTAAQLTLARDDDQQPNPVASKRRFPMAPFAGSVQGSAASRGVDPAASGEILRGNLSATDPVRLGGAYGVAMVEFQPGKDSHRSCRLGRCSRSRCCGPGCAPPGRRSACARR